MNRLDLMNEDWHRQVQGLRWTPELSLELSRLNTNRIVELTGHKPREHSYVAILDSKNHVKSIGLNDPRDLILNNFGTWLAAILQSVTQAGGNISLTDTGGSARTLGIYHATLCFNDRQATSVGTKVQVGSQDGDKARTDTNIGAAFGVAPENAPFNTGNGTWTSVAGTITFSGNIVAGGAGTVHETGFYIVWTDTASTARTIMMAHDHIHPGVPFVLGNTITVNWTWQL